jgi:hypothetical protein
MTLLFNRSLVSLRRHRSLREASCAAPGDRRARSLKNSQRDDRADDHAIASAPEKFSDRDSPVTLNTKWAQKNV